MEKLMEDFKNYASFLFYENNQECEITIYNDEKVLQKYIIEKEEAEQILLKRCLNYGTLELVSAFDTIGLKIADKFNSYVRYAEEPGVIKNLDYGFIPYFLCTFLETLQKKARKIKISSGKDNCGKPEMKIVGEMQEIKFYITFKVDLKWYFPYIISVYMNRHKTVNVKEASYDESQILLDGIEFPSNLLSKEQKQYCISQILEKYKSSYAELLASPFWQNMSKKLQEQDDLQRVRLKKEGEQS